METLRLARATHQLLERGVEALEKIWLEFDSPEHSVTQYETII